MSKAFRYWDFEPEQRASMTRDQVEAFTAVQLMEKGIIKPDPLPSLDECPKPPELQTETWYKCADVLFRTHAQATAFLGLDPHKSTYDWQYSRSDCSYAEPHTSVAITPVILFNRDSVIANKDILAKIRAFKDERSKREDDYNKAFKAAQEAVADIWADWFQCQENARELAKVRSTFDEYCRMSNDDKKIAFGFLCKTYGERLSRNALSNDVLIEVGSADADMEFVAVSN